MPIEQVDRDAANNTPFDHLPIAAKLLAETITAAEQRGREQERAAIVAWLRTGFNQHRRQLADAIEAGEHITAP